MRKFSVSRLVRESVVVIMDFLFLSCAHRSNAQCYGGLRVVGVMSSFQGWDMSGGLRFSRVCGTLFL